MRPIWSGIDLVRARQRARADVLGDRVEGAPVPLPAQGRPAADRLRQGAQGHGQARRSRRVVRGFEIEKGRYVPIEDEDLDRLDIELTHSIDILDFVRPRRDRPDLLPQGLLPRAAGRRREALPPPRSRAGRDRKGRDRQGRDPEQAALAALSGSRRRARPRDDVLRGRGAEARSRVNGKTRLQKAEVEMAKSLVENLSGSFKPEKYDDTYRKELLDLIRSKAKGKKLRSRRRKRRPRSST